MGNPAFHSTVPEISRTDLNTIDFKAKSPLDRIGMRIDVWQEKLKHELPELPIEIALVDGNPSNKVRVHVILPISVSPHDEALTGKLREIFGGISINTHTTRWDVQTPVAFMAVKDDGRSWEIEIKNKPSIELGDFWRDVFSESELQWQKKVEENCSTGELLHESFRMSLIIECRYRIVAAAAISRLLDQELTSVGVSKLPVVSFNDEQIRVLEPLAEKWLSGQVLPDEIARPLVVSGNWIDFVIKGGEVPEEPKWVTAAHKAREAVAEATTYFSREAQPKDASAEISKLVQSIFSDIA